MQWESLKSIRKHRKTLGNIGKLKARLENTSKKNTKEPTQRPPKAFENYNTRKNITNRRTLENIGKREENNGKHWKT